MKKSFLSAILATMIFSSGMAQSCDTLFNLQSNLDTAVLLAADTDLSAGYLAGNNEYGDVAKAEAFAAPDTGYYITSATFYFGYVAINPTDTNVMVNIFAWDNTGASITGGSAPGNILNATVVTLGEIAQSVSEGKGLLVNFAGGVELTDTFYVGLFLPTATGDTVALLTNAAPPGPDGNGWELSAQGNWNSYNNDWQVTGGSLGNYIAAGVCNAPPADSPSAYFGYSGSGCSLAPISFSDSTSPAPDAWSWTFGDGNSSNAQNPIYAYAAPGTYLVTELASSDTGEFVQVFMAAADSITVIPSPVIAATATAPAAGDSTGSVYIVVTGVSDHYFVTWSNGDINDTLYSVSPGTYTVTVADQLGCQTVDSIFVPFALGIIQLGPAGQVKVYPNPATDVLNLEWSQKMNAEISVLDMNGNVLSTLINPGDRTTVLDIHTLATGAYILRITDLTSNKQESLLFTKL